MSLFYNIPSRAPADNQAVEGQIVDGQTVEGQTVDGQAVEGQAVDGQAVDGPALDQAMDDNDESGKFFAPAASISFAMLMPRLREKRMGYSHLQLLQSQWITATRLPLTAMPPMGL
jgi:hypothetical protein